MPAIVLVAETPRNAGEERNAFFDRKLDLAFAQHRRQQPHHRLASAPPERLLGDGGRV